MSDTSTRRLFYPLSLLCSSLFVFAFSGCSAISSMFEPDPPEPTVIDLKVESTRDLNNGRPIVARIYTLKSSDGFSSADFFAIYQNDKSILGGDIDYREEIELIPDQSREIKLEPKPETRFIAAFGAFRDLETAQWRAVAEIPPNQTTPMKVQFQKNAVTIEIVVPEQDPPPEE